VLLCGDAAMCCVMRMGGGDRDPLSSKNPLPEGEGGSHRVWGTVVAVFARSFYLADGAGSLACIGPPGLGRGPLNMLCDLPADLDWPRQGLRSGIFARRDGEILYLDGVGAFSLADAAAWRSPAPPCTWNAATLAKGLAALAVLAEAEPRNDGLVRLVAPLARGRIEEVGAAISPLLRSPLREFAALASGWWVAATRRRTRRLQC